MTETASSMQELFLDQLRDLYNAEKQITAALPKIAKAATDEKLREAFEGHLEETHGHVERLERIFQDLGEPSTGKKCKGMEGLLEEGSEALEGDLSGVLRDALLIAAAQRVEHYEIAGYGTVKAWAEELGFDDAAELLDETLDEEAAADEKLTSIAEGGLVREGVNEGAAAK